MICNNCGLTLKDTSRFCAGCGTAAGGNSAELSPNGASVSLSPIAALIADYPAQSDSRVSCINHSSTAATGSCSDCRNFFCRDCMVNITGKNHCRSCATRLQRSQPQSAPPYLYQSTTPLPSTLPGYQAYQRQPAPIYQYQVQVNPYVSTQIYVKRKEPGIALLLSFLLPGLGQFYNGDVGKGIAFMFGFFALVWIGIGVVFWVWAMIDAYQSATNINLGTRV